MSNISHEQSPLEAEQRFHAQIQLLLNKQRLSVKDVSFLVELRVAAIEAVSAGSPYPDADSLVQQYKEAIERSKHTYLYPLYEVCIVELCGAGHVSNIDEVAIWSKCAAFLGEQRLFDLANRSQRELLLEKVRISNSTNPSWPYALKEQALRYEEVKFQPGAVQKEEQERFQQKLLQATRYYLLPADEFFSPYLLDLTMDQKLGLYDIKRMFVSQLTEFRRRKNLDKSLSNDLAHLELAVNEFDNDRMYAVEELLRTYIDSIEAGMEDRIINIFRDLIVVLANNPLFPAVENSTQLSEQYDQVFNTSEKVLAELQQLIDEDEDKHPHTKRMLLQAKITMQIRLQIVQHNQQKFASNSGEEKS